MVYKVGKCLDLNLFCLSNTFQYEVDRGTGKKWGGYSVIKGYQLA